MTLVAGIDSSTQSCKVVIRDADSGRLIRHGSAAHPPGTEIEPRHWWDALRAAIAQAGGLAEVAAISVAGQQHGLICLDADGEVLRPALLWNDTRSADAARDLVTELGDGDRQTGALRWAEAVGSVPVASITASKLRWVAEHEPEVAARIAAVALPHDWLTWQLTGARSLDTLTTDRSDASGTGWFDAAGGRYRRDLLALALGRSEDGVASLVLPRVCGPSQAVGRLDPAYGFGDALVGPGCGDNAGAALGLGLSVGQACLSVGTSGVISCVADRQSADASGLVTGFADATGRFLPLVCTLNGSPVLDAMARALSVDHARLSELALTAEPGAGGLLLVPYLEGERTPNLPNATGTLTGMTGTNLTPANLARAAVEGLLCLLAEGLAALSAQDIPVAAVTLVGGGARSQALRTLAPSILGVPVLIPPPGESVAAGAARQAAWVLRGCDAPPHWPSAEVVRSEAEPNTVLRARYQQAARAAAAGGS